MAQLRKEFVAVMNHRWPFPWHLSSTNTEVADAARKQMVDIMAGLRLHTSPCWYHTFNTLGVGKYLPHTHSQVTPTLKQGSAETVVGAEGGAAETRLGRQKIEKGKEEKEEQLGSSPAERKVAAEKKCYAIWTARTSRDAIKGVILSNDITESLFMALPNIIIRSFWHSQEAEPFLSPGPDQVLM